MKRVALVGFGFMGRTHYGAWKKCRGAKVVAICVRNPARLTEKVEGNIAGAADNEAVPKSVRIWTDFGEMLKAGGFDIVDITVPTVRHPEMTIAALRAGYHVLCEKPMALDVRDCDRMLAAARTAKRQLMVAQCVRFFPEYAYVRELVRSGRYGKVIAADFSRFVAPPKWSPKGADWFLDEKKSGGVLFDLHVHDADFILGTFGAPQAVSTTFHRTATGRVDHTSTVYRYADALITSDSSFAAASSFVWEATGRVFFEKATVFFGPFCKQPLTVCPEGGKPFSPKLAKLSGYEAEVRYFLRQVEENREGDVLTAQDARDVIALLACEYRSGTRGRPVVLDARVGF